MGAFQKKAEDSLRQLASELKVDADFEYRYSNTGRVFFRKGFFTIASMSFAFQPDYATFHLSPGNKVIQTVIGARQANSYYIEYGNSHQFLDLIHDLKRDFPEYIRLYGH